MLLAQPKIYLPLRVAFSTVKRSQFRTPHNLPRQQIANMASTAPEKMEYTRLGNSGLKISKVIYGAMSFGSPDWQEWVIDEAAALPLLKVRDPHSSLERY